MPTYNAFGITATLSVANLKASLSNFIDLKQGQEHRDDIKRMNDILTTGRNLSERPLSEASSAKRVLQFIGQEDDIPFFMVEAGDGVGHKQLSARAVKRPDTIDTKPLRPFGILQKIDFNAPLSGSKERVNGSTLSGSFETPSVPARPENPRSKLRNQQKSQSKSSAAFDCAPGSFDQLGGPYALCLTVCANGGSFLPRTGQHRGTPCRNLKLEVFVNGEFGGAAFINKRGSAVELIDNKARFHGTRIHRQMEKPWVYDAEAAAQTGSSKGAMQRWDAICASLKKEVEARGRNKWSDPCPSAQLLFALTQLEMPAKLKEKPSFGVVDLVITAGYGKKHGPESGYITSPTRMTDKEHNISNTTSGAVTDDFMLLNDAADDVGPLHHAYAGLAGSSEIQRCSGMLTPETPTKRNKNAVNFSSVLKLANLDSLDLSKRVAAYENSRRRAGRTRTLKQRLKDIKQMNPENRRRELLALREQFDGGSFIELNKRATEQDACGPPRKRQLVPDGESNLGVPTDDDRATTATTDCLAEPQEKPTNGTKCTKTSHRSHSDPKELNLNDSPIPIDPRLTVTRASAKRSARGANRTSRAWNPYEQTALQALKAFKVPLLSDGCAVTYGQDETQRQIGKARGGVFKEEEVIVGMRFVVV